MDNVGYGQSRGRETDRVRSRALHFSSRFDEKRGLFRFVCDSQPLITLTSHGIPRRCPFCGQNYPIKNET